MLDEIKNLQNFVDKGVRRVVVLQGVPGTGKSTLCAHASEILSDRTIVLSNTILMHLSRNDWSEVIKLLSPTMVIIDDIDRSNMRSLETSLYLFEDTYYDVPLTLLTTNDQQKLPDAFRRPGRIDQIIEMPEPTKSIRKKIIKQMAEREGVGKIPSDKIDMLDSIVEKYPVAYLVELLRRYRSLGWDYQVPDNDIVFAPIMEELGDSPTRTHEVLDRGRSSVFEEIGPEDQLDGA
ncbi:AAA family ATPase [Candidatus Bathyarchaeota archaeon]|nr:AAA family ATPase [Candidatus Bathyarchaeota archaeon]NIR13108.1 AAA family ATPase [Desulfobacterales bacterium]NIV67848.1 AAA family ATPase [Candidatus Bathyarchaeota archaeon]NIW34437.1 AAA family ATPase [Candidatus Bathyarchaeota archaeon]